VPALATGCPSAPWRALIAPTSTVEMLERRRLAAANARRFVSRAPVPLNARVELPLAPAMTTTALPRVSRRRRVARPMPN